MVNKLLWKYEINITLCNCLWHQSFLLLEKSQTVPAQHFIICLITQQSLGKMPRILSYPSVESALLFALRFGLDTLYPQWKKTYLFCLEENIHYHVLFPCFMFPQHTKLHRTDLPPPNYLNILNIRHLARDKCQHSIKGRGKEGAGKAQYEGTLVTTNFYFIQFTNKQIDKPINLQIYKCKIYQDSD